MAYISTNFQKSANFLSYILTSSTFPGLDPFIVSLLPNGLFLLSADYYYARTSYSGGSKFSALDCTYCLI